MSTQKDQDITDWYNRHSDAIFKFILLMVHDYQLAEDLTHDTFVKAYNHHETFLRNAQEKTWLFRIAHNVTVDYIRKRKPVLLFKTLLPMIDKDPLPEEVVEFKENSRELYEAISQLKTNYQKVIILRKIKGFSIEETSKILDWSTSKVKTTLHRALPALEKKLTKEGFLHEETISKKS